jgi:hypothetical protein
VVREEQQPGWTSVGSEQREFVVEELIRDLDCPEQIGVDFANRRTGSVYSPTPTATPTEDASHTVTPINTPTRTSTSTRTNTPTLTPVGPAIVRLVPDFAPQGTSRLQVTIEGINFKPGAVVTFQPALSGIALIPPEPPNLGFEGPTELRQRINIAPDALLGPRDVFVTNLDGRSGGIHPFNVFFVTTPDPGSCTGDCDGDGRVTETEIETGLNIPFDPGGMSECPRFDRNGNGRVDAAEIVAAMNDRIVGCEPITLAPGSCCEVNDFVPGCNLLACQDCVCRQRPECCTQGWDADCVEDSLDACPWSCPCAAVDDCCAAHSSAGCVNSVCEACVCDNEPFCCGDQYFWRTDCLALADFVCSADCMCLAEPF